MQCFQIFVFTLALLLGFHSEAQERNRFFRFSFNQAVTKKASRPQLLPFGFEAEYNFRKKAESPVGMGVSMSYQNYGLTNHADLRTSHNIYALDLSLTFDIFKSKRFSAFFRGALGLNRFVSRSFQGTNELGHLLAIIAYLIDEDNDDIETEPLVVLKKFTSFKPSLSGSINLEWKTNKANAFFVAFGYRSIGRVLLVSKND